MMIKKISKRAVTFILAVIMLITVLPIQPVAAEEAAGSVTNYADFMVKFKQLEIYADEYAKAVGRDAGELVLNFIRTGVERYQDDNWTTLAGQEIIGFTNYVKSMDEDVATGKEGCENNVANVMDLRDIVIDNFTLPNGNKVDFGHMFGCMNISYVAPGSADLSGWAGDLCDLLQYSVKNIDSIPDGTLEEMVTYIRQSCFGVDAEGAFGWDDFWGDMDAYYLISEYKKANGTKKFSELMEALFTGSLNDTDRTVYFMNNRFGVAGETPEEEKAAVRKAIYESYSDNVGIGILEAKRGLSSYSTLRQACCYAVADYIYEKAQGQLIESAPGEDGAANGYYSVFSDEYSVLAPGIEQNIKYAQTVDGKQIVYYVATVDVTQDDVDIIVNYNNNKPPVGNNIGLQTVRGQVNALIKNHANDEGYYYPIVATNGAGYNSQGVPGGLVVMQGVEYYPIGAPGFFAMLSDGTAVIGDQAKYAELKEQGVVKEAIQAFGSVLVKDGKVCVTKSANYTSNRASRTAIGITAEGKVVMMVLDGRQLPRSAGGSLEEIAQIMLEAGCVQAVNLDGGGSTTYLSKPAGSDEIQLVNVPSDGTERNVSTSLVAISTAAPSTAFESAVISSDYEYITAGTSMQFTVTGVSNTGNAAIIPEGSYWTTSDEAIGIIDENGVFTAQDYGTVKVQFIVDGKVAGEKTISVVIPDDIKFAEDRITAIYGVPKEIELTLWYQGYPVAFTPLVDAVVVFAENEDLVSDAGVIDGMTFTGNETSGIRTVKLIAGLPIGDEDILIKYATISMYKADEATFDFANATMGNRSFAWIREIENARTLDNQLYRVSDDSDIVIDYTFALDMTAIDFPPQLEPMKSMLPTYSENATAWDYLLQLAERVCTQTTVTIKAEFSPNLEVDISELNVMTEYFTPTSIVLDANNVLTIVCQWVNQSHPIDPATANSLCILTGIKATVKDTAAFYDNKVAINNKGNVTYDIYLAASSLYSYAQKAENQATYGLYPYIHEEDCRSDFSNPEEDETTATNNDKGAHFASQYLDFADDYLISTEILNGWYEEGKDYYYYENNVPVTGIQLVPSRTNAEEKKFYEFDATGKLASEQGTTGLIPFDGALYYATNGVIKTGWQQIDGNNYYFHPDTGKALNGVQTIKEFVFPEQSDKDNSTGYYTYTFENYILVRGDLRENENIQNYVGTRYRWAGTWIRNRWFTVDGNTYHVNSNRKVTSTTGKVDGNWTYMVTTGYAHYIPAYGREGANAKDQICVLFDEKGVLQEDLTGVKTVTLNGTDRTVFFKNGVVCDTPGLHCGNDGYYYFVNNGQELGSWIDGAVIKGQSFYVNSSKTNGLVTANKTYTFDEYGRLKEELVTVTPDATVTGVTTEVIGRVTTVTAAENTPACKVGYLDGDKYVTIEATKNADGTYNFAAPKEASKVTIVVAGDAKGDGKVDEDDVTNLLESILGKLNSDEELSAEEMLAADINGDGKFTAIDVALINAAVKKVKDLGW